MAANRVKLPRVRTVTVNGAMLRSAFSWREVSFGDVIVFHGGISDLAGSADRLPYEVLVSAGTRRCSGERTNAGLLRLRAEVDVRTACAGAPFNA